MRRAIEEDVHSLFERRQHENALFELCNTEASNTQNLHAALRTANKESYQEDSYLALEAHEISEQHHVTRINFETKGVTHGVLEFINDPVACGLNAQRAAYLHDVIAGDAGASHATGRHNLSEAAALHVSTKV